GAHEADTALHEIADDAKVIALHQRMSGAAVGVAEDAADAFEGLVLVGPAVGVADNFEARELLQALLENVNAGVEFMGAGAMARLAGEHHELLRSLGGSHGKGADAGGGRAQEGAAGKIAQTHRILLDRSGGAAGQRPKLIAES